MQYTKFSFQNRHGVSLNAHQWTASSTPECVVGIVHGLGEHGARFGPVAEWLVQQDCTVLAYDQQGHGTTGGPLPSFESLLEDLDVYIEQLKRVHPVVFLYGQSLGGGLVVNYALRKMPSIHGVIASSPLFRPTHPPPAWKLFIAKTLGRIWPSLTLGTAINAQELSHDPEAIKRYLADPLVHRRISATLGMTMLDAGEWALQNGAQLETPMLLMHGDADAITSPTCSKEFAAKAGGVCQLRIWEGLYHDLHFETEREAVLSYAANWIRSKIDGNA